MTELEYCDASDLTTLRNIKDMLRNLNCFEDLNKARRMSVMANIDLMINHANGAVKVD